MTTSTTSTTNEHKQNQPEKLERAIVIARGREDVTWASLYLDYPLYFITHSDPLAKRRYNVPLNKAQEASSYLLWVLEHYENLPKYTVFIHANRTSWHLNRWKDNLDEIINNLRWGKYPFMSLNYNQEQELRPGHVDWNTVKSVWSELFAQELGPMPSRWWSYCCAQFVVEQNQILKHPKSFYQHLYNWTQSTKMSNYHSSRVFEHTWQLIWGVPFQKTVYNRSKCELIYCDGGI